MSRENSGMEIVRKINALLMVGVVYAMSLPTALSCCCDIETGAACPDGAVVTSCCSNTGSTQPEDSQQSSDCRASCECECFYLETPVRAWKASDEFAFTADLLTLTSLEPPLPVQASTLPADPPSCTATHNVRQSQLCVWRK